MKGAFPGASHAPLETINTHNFPSISLLRQTELRSISVAPAGHLDGENALRRISSYACERVIGDPPVFCVIGLRSLDELSLCHHLTQGSPQREVQVLKSH